jgi:hypothetical protein
VCMGGVGQSKLGRCIALDWIVLGAAQDILILSLLLENADPCAAAWNLAADSSGWAGKVGVIGARGLQKE